MKTWDASAYGEGNAPAGGVPVIYNLCISFTAQDDAHAHERAEEIFSSLKFPVPLEIWKLEETQED